MGKIDGHGENSNMGGWDGGNSSRYQLFPSTSTFPNGKLYTKQHDSKLYRHGFLCTICPSYPPFSLAVILFYRYEKTSLPAFLYSSTPGRAQPDSISSIHSYKSLPRYSKFWIFSHNFWCISKILFM